MIVAAVMSGVFLFIPVLSYLYTLRGIKNKKAGNGQHGTARWASHKERKETYERVKFEPQKWRNNADSRPTVQGIVVGCETHGNATTALVDTGDVHCMMIGAAGVGKTAYWLYPNIEYACASGMSFLSTDTKGDIMRNYGNIASKYYGYNISVIDLRNPMRSHGNNLLHLVNKYTDMYEKTKQVQYKAKAEKYANAYPRMRQLLSGRALISPSKRRFAVANCPIASRSSQRSRQVCVGLQESNS